MQRSFFNKSTKLGPILLVLLCLSLIIAEKFYNISPYTDKLSLTISSPFYYIYDKSSSLKKEFLDIYFDSKKLIEQKEKLLAENLKLKAVNNKLLSLEIENQKLNDLIGMSKKIKRDYIFAKNISISTKSKDKIIVNKGSNDGVKEGMPVINAKGIVGIINSTASNTSSILTIHSANIGIPAKTMQNGIKGIVVSHNLREILLMRVFINNTSIKLHDKIVSSGLGGLFGEGYPIGSVERIHYNNSQAVTEIYIKPSVNVSEVDNVLILK